MVLKEKKVDIYDIRQAVAERHFTPDAAFPKYYQIFIMKSELIGGEWRLQPLYAFFIDDVSGKILTQEDIDERVRQRTSHRGKQL